MQCSGHGPNTASLLTHAGNGHPILRLELLILRSFFHLCTLRYEVLHFRFEAAPYFDSELRRLVRAKFPPRVDEYDRESFK